MRAAPPPAAALPVTTPSQSSCRLRCFRLCSTAAPYPSGSRAQRPRKGAARACPAALASAAAKARPGPRPGFLWEWTAPAAVRPQTAPRCPSMESWQVSGRGGRQRQGRQRRWRALEGAAAMRLGAARGRGAARCARRPSRGSKPGTPPSASSWVGGWLVCGGRPARTACAVQRDRRGRGGAGRGGAVESCRVSHALLCAGKRAAEWAPARGDLSGSSSLLQTHARKQDGEDARARSRLLAVVITSQPYQCIRDE
jgi:hypothetical protein